MSAFSLLKPQLTASLLADMINDTFEMDECAHLVSISPSEFSETIATDGKLPTFNRSAFEEVLLNLDAIGVVELAVHAIDGEQPIAHYIWHGVVRDPFELLAKSCCKIFSSGAWPRAANKRGPKKPTLLIEWPLLDFNWEDWLFGFFQASAGYYSGPLTKAEINKGSWSRSFIPDDLAAYVGKILAERSASELVLAGGRGERIRETILNTYC
ncbi:hypothetical protein [Shinella kummerowiae]|uniref:hypothetical protein n=1 Tax=Shinella kummerowiae TaxID=417745 RepID=UPI0021B69F8B|nr:hypothetical protein [Shinella kummerowiae]MCT7663543.1 hypothetical protein [Shinella kummerowiae]